MLSLRETKPSERAEKLQAFGNIWSPRAYVHERVRIWSSVKPDWPLRTRAPQLTLLMHLTVRRRRRRRWGGGRGAVKEVWVSATFSWEKWQILWALQTWFDSNLGHNSSHTKVRGELWPFRFLVLAGMTASTFSAEPQCVPTLTVTY